MSTSGTVATTVFNTRKVIDHAFRRCRLTPQQITSEHIETAKDLLWLFLSTLASKGIALWCLERSILPLYGYQPQVPLPQGTVDLFYLGLRQVQRLTGTYTATEGDPDLAFDGDIDTACTQVTDAGSIQFQLDSATEMTTFGILPESSGQWDFTVQVSNDGSTWTTVYTASDLEVEAGTWVWFDVSGQYPQAYARIQAGVGTILDVSEFVVANTPSEIPLSKVNRDDYDNLPNKSFPSRPTEFWYDRKRVTAYAQLWPVPAPEFTFYQLVARTQRYIQDVGTLTQEIEVPQRWYLAIICELARQLGYEIKEVSPDVLPGLTAEATNQLRIAWDGETDSAPTRFSVNISPYTR